MVRKAHQKSRRGCLCCKRRHVKCSETRPRCQHCTRLGIECTWPEGSEGNAVASGSQSQSQSHSQSHSPAGTIPPFSVISPGPFLPSLQASSHGVSRSKPQPELSVNDLKLLHFYLFNTSASMTSKESQYMWQNVVVDIGFRHHFLLHGILAVAATHKATVFPSEQEDLLVQSAAHMDIGLRAFRKCLESPLPAVCVPVFLMAGLLSVHALGAAQVHAPMDPIGDICMWMRMVKGTKSTIHENWQFLLSSEIGSMLQNHPFGAAEPTSLAEIDDLRTLVEQTSPQGSKELSIYLNCVEQLRSVFISDRRTAPGDKQASSLASTWAATVSEGYCDLLTQRQPLALVIIAYFSTLFLNNSGAWWFRNWGLWILDAVQAALPTEYEPWLEWPKGRIGSTTSTPSGATT